MPFHWPLILALVAGCVVLFFIERRGGPVVLSLSVKNDINRETFFLQQYGQFTCVAIVVAVVYLLGGSRWRGHGPGIVLPLALAPVMAGAVGMLLKRLLGRVRPGYENAGRFLGPAWRHCNRRESFPSNHSAAAMALSVGLAYLYPPASPVFWALAGLTGLLRYLQDAHWPSDVLGGLAVGYLVAVGTWQAVARFDGFTL